MRRLTITYRRLLGYGLLFVPGVASAADTAETNGPVMAFYHTFLVNLLPLILCLVIPVGFGLLIRVYYKKHRQNVDRVRQHMDILEENVARIKTELEEIRKEIKAKSP